jgi:hypothetical protein
MDAQERIQRSLAREAYPLKFTQIQVVPVPNTGSTQCVAFMYGLDDNGLVWFKRDNDDRWSPEPMMSNGEDHAAR